MTIISRATLCGAFAGLGMLIGAMHGPAEAALSFNALSFNALTSNGTRQDAATPGVTVLQDLNGVAVEGVVLPPDARR